MWKKLLKEEARLQKYSRDTGEVCESAAERNNVMIQ